jgi:transcriptional regulator with XRE-family HTH domain
MSLDVSVVDNVGSGRHDRQVQEVEPEYRELGATVRRLRRERGLSQQRVAKDCDMSRSALANIEAGHQRVAFHQFLALARALRTDPRELLPQQPPADHPVDEQLIRLGVPERAAKAIAKVVGKVTENAESTSDDQSGTSGSAPAGRSRDHEGASTR